MKATQEFARTIGRYLASRAEESPLFAEMLENPRKSTDGCVSYILGCVRDSGCNGFTDDEIFGMAVHYYEEDSLEAVGPVKCTVVVNHQVELTPEEIQEAKERARQDLLAQETNRLRSLGRTRQKSEEATQMSLFDM